MKTKITRGLTIALFTTLIVGFVAYKSGFLGLERTSYSENADLPLPNPTDSLRKPGIMPSSKSMPLIDHSLPIVTNSNEGFDSMTSPLDEEDWRLMSSSKSGIVFQPDESIPTHSLSDSITTDSVFGHAVDSNALIESDSPLIDSKIIND